MPKLNGAFVVDSTAVTDITIEGSGAYSRTTIDRSAGCRNLVQRVITVREGGDLTLRNEVSEEVLFVVSGRGAATIEKRGHALLANTGLLIPPGLACHIMNSSGDDLMLVSVISPQPGQKPVTQADAILRPDGKISVHEAEELEIPAGDDRYFKLLIDPRYGCRNLTQFMGFIEKAKRRSTPTPTKKSSTSSPEKASSMLAMSHAR